MNNTHTTKGFAKRLLFAGGLALAVLGTLMVSEGTLLRFGTDEASAWHCVALTASPATITEGDSTTLSWEFGKDTGIWVTIDELPGQKWDGVQGSTVVSPSATMTYTARAHKKGSPNEPTCVTKVVVEKAPELCPECTLTADVTEITRGEGVTLTWTSKDGETATIDNGVGSVDLNGGTVVYPTSNTTYTLTVTSKDGKTIDCEVHIVVHEPPVDAPVCTLTASPTTITKGGNSTLTLTSENADTATIDQGIGNTATNTSLSVVPTVDTTYTATVTGKGGTVTCSAPIIVEVPTEPTPVCGMTVDDSLITKGASTTVRWSSSNATAVSFTNIAGTALTGDEVVSPSVDTTYTGVWRNAKGATTTCAVTVKVEEPTVTPTPLCSLNISSNSVKKGESVTLTWDSTYTKNASFDQGIGAVATSGSKAVVVDADTTYTGTFTGVDDSTLICAKTVTISSGGGGGGCINCGDDDDDDDDGGGGGGGGGGGSNPKPNILLSSTITKAGGFITLDQVPYTGFEAGPLLTMAFWLGVLALSAAIAYVVTVTQPLTRVYAALAARHHEYVRTEEVQRAQMAEVGVPTRTYNFSAMPASSFTPTSDAHAGGTDDSSTFVETVAHRENILLSPEALRTILSEIERSGVDRTAFLTNLFDRAKADYAREDGWILLSKDRANTLLSTQSDNDHGTESANETRTPVAAPIADTVTQRVRMNEMKSAGLSEYVQPADNTARAVAPTHSFSKSAPVSVGTFVGWLVNAEEQKTFEYLRTASATGNGVELFIGEVVRALDDVYKHRLEGNHNPDPELARLTATWSNGDFEQVLGILVECIDFSYSSNRIGSKVALAKAFDYFRGKKA